MGYTICLHSPPPSPPCPTCGRSEPVPEEPDCPNPTYNLTEIFDLALSGEEFPNPTVSEIAVVLMGTLTDRPRGLRLLDGKKAGDTVKVLDEAIVRLRDESLKPRFEALQPENGWGDLTGAVEVIWKLKALAEAYPNNVWYVR